jgi:hypothetical protein
MLLLLLVEVVLAFHHQLLEVRMLSSVYPRTCVCKYFLSQSTLTTLAPFKLAVGFTIHTKISTPLPFVARPIGALNVVFLFVDFA